MKFMLNKKFIMLGLVLTVNSVVQAREISYADEELISDFALSASSSLFGDLSSADIDGDGDKDIVVSKISPVDQVSWLENDGGDLAGFPVHVVSTATQGFKALQVVDIDQDGDIDIIGTDQTTGELLWFENDGVGSTWASHTIQSGTSTNNSMDLSIVDIDADGDLDIVVAADDSFKLYWYENGGIASTWTEHDTGIITAGAVSSIATGDFNLDGTTDIVYGLVSGTPYIKLVGNINGDGSIWVTSTVASGTVGTINDIQVADLDLDGLAEIYFNVFNNNLTKLTYDRFAATWSSSVVIAGGTQGKTSFSDIDNDGDLDVLSGNSINLSWHENTDGIGGAWTERVLISGLSDRIDSVHAVDLDQDGDLEIIATKNEDGYIYVYDNLLFHSSVQYAAAVVIDDTHTNAYHVVTGQLNGDQYPDLISANNSFTGMEIFFYAGDGSGSYALSETVLSVLSATDSNITAIALGDMDNDGDLDIVFAADGSNSIYMIENQMDAGPYTASKSQAEESFFGANWGSEILIGSAVGKSAEIQLTDINSDGTIDVVFLDQINDKVEWLNNNGSWAATEIGTVDNQTNLKVGYLNSDGYIDVITSGTSIGGSHLFTNDNGDASVWSEIIIDTTRVPRQIAIADLDGDGDLDVVHARSAGFNIDWQENNGDGTSWTRHDSLVSTGFTPNEIVVVDYDNNGTLDILIQDSHGDISVMEFNDIATDSWSLTTLTTGLSLANSLVALDFDFDGDIDLVSKGLSSSEIVSYENIGGQYGLAYVSAAANSHEELENVAVVSFTVTHNGEMADGDMQVSSLHLGFQPGTGCVNTPMNSSDFNPLVAAIGVYLDDGSGVFELFSDTLITTETGPFNLVSGQITLTLPDQNNDLQIVPQSSKDYFVTLKIRATASSQTCHGLVPFFFVDNNLGVSDYFRAQDRDTGIELTAALTEDSAPNEQLIIASTNTAPTTTGILDQNLEEDILFNLNIAGDFNDADGDDLFFTAIGLPITLSMDGLTGVISGVPNTMDAMNSPFTINIIARDPQGATVNSVFGLGIAGNNTAPTVSNPRGDFSMTQGDSLNTSVLSNFNDSDGDILTFSTTGLPAGLNITNNGNFIGMITNLDWLNGPIYNVSVRATDPDGEFIEDLFDITVINVNDGPLFSGPIDVQNGEFNVVLALDVSTFFVDPDGDSMTYSADVLPEGLSISTDGNITGIPTSLAYTNSPYAVTITVIDPDGETTSSNQFVFNINDASNDIIFVNGME